jgi:hypothetical protein
MSPDPRLVAALAAAMHEEAHEHRRNGIFTPGKCFAGPRYERQAAAILPAFLADPRTHEWLAERLRSLSPWKDDDTFERVWSDEAAAILGTEP